MKKTLYFIAIVLLLVSCKQAETTPADDNTPATGGETGTTTEEPQTFDPDVLRCYSENTEEGTITFIYDLAVFGKKYTEQKVQVRGSFTSWKQDDKYQLQYDEEKNGFYLTLPYNDMRRPGNSGQPEYKFCVNGSYVEMHSKFPKEYRFHSSDNNPMVIFAKDDFDYIQENSASANVLKKPSDFDLTTEAGQRQITNFRQVPGTTQLYRSYHPFKTSRTFESEYYRMLYLDTLYTKYDIQSDICLSENETGNLKTVNLGGHSYTEHFPAVYQRIIDNNSVLYVGTANGRTPSYNAVYYESQSEAFGQWLQEVVAFINDDAHHTPFSIHCAIGTDRTGVFSATIAALCGASWEEIHNDYQLINQVGIREFRDYHLLQYAFEQMLGVDDLDALPNLGQAVNDHFVGSGILTQQDIDKMVAKLNAR